MNSSAQHYAAVLKRRNVKQGARSDYDPCISQPVLDCDLGSLPSTPLIGWMHFNPLGPTISSLFYVPVPEAKRGNFLLSDLITPSSTSTQRSA